MWLKWIFFNLINFYLDVNRPNSTVRIMKVASFIICFQQDGIVATTRDKGNLAVGLPGGKADDGETPRQAAIREAAEEGWKVFGVSRKPVRVKAVDGFQVFWFTAEKAVKLESFKEKGRITPIVTDIATVASGYGNEFILSI